MDQERWRRIEDSVQRALDLEPAARARYLDEASAGDAVLRDEIEALLRHEPQAASFLESPAVVRLAAEASSQSPSLTAGQEIDHYRIESWIGTGGMGEVYAAEDRVLGRSVAIKLLPVGCADDSERVQRFRQEAHAASQLNHPNIITIFETRQVGGRHLLVTELVPGRTLRSLIQDGPLQLTEALDVAIQVASALDAAHQAAIVHRDIKPENVMLRPDGLVKVLDFGLAKLRASPPLQRVEPQSKGWLKSEPGRAMGTAGYMSPEQVRGLHVDHRSDLFSLGVLLFEMVTGSRPFQGSTDADVLAAVLRQEPPALSGLPPGPQLALERLLRKALDKDRERRHRSAADLVGDLRQLQREIGLAGTSDHASAESAAPAFPARPRIRDRRWVVAAAALVATGVAAALGVFLAQRSHTAVGRDDARSAALDITRVVVANKVQDAVISPDGRYLAYSTKAIGARSLWLHGLTSPGVREVVPVAAGQMCRWPQFSPDGRTLYYVVRDREQGVNALYRVPVPGGTPLKLLDRVDSPIAVSPDGSAFAFMREEQPSKETALVVASVSGGATSRLATRREPMRMPAAKPAWSPDGKRVAFAAGTLGTEDDHRILSVPAAGGAETALSSHTWRRLRDLVWLPDDSGLVMLAGEGYLHGNQHQVWHLGFRDDERRQLTAVSFDNESLSVTADGRELVTVQEEVIRGLWVFPVGDPNGARRLLSGGQAGRWGLTWSSDDEILYAGGPKGSQQIWRVDRDGRNARQLTFGGGDDDGPAASPDGRFLLYASRRPSSTVCNIWRMERDTGRTEQLTFGKLDVDPVCSPAGGWVVYVSWDDTATASIMKVSLSGGPPVKLVSGITTNPSPAVSPDGRRLAYYREIRGEHDDEQKRIEIASMDGGAPSQSFEMLESDYLVRWTPDAAALVFVRAEEDAGTNLLRLDLKDGSRKRLTDFKSDTIGRFAISPAGTHIGFSRSTANRDIIRITGFQQSAPQRAAR